MTSSLKFASSLTLVMIPLSLMLMRKMMIEQKIQKKNKLKYIAPGVIIKLVDYRFKPYTKMKLIQGHQGEIGAVATFEGITRNNFEGKTVVDLEYEAYNDMAVKMLATIAKQALEKFPGLSKVVIIHRLGTCPVGETSLFVGTISAHRAPALQAIPFIVDELKSKVPIWKLEKYDEKSGNAEWKENMGWDPEKLPRSS
jgi:molybdopterin synthase catalytic subunit